MLKLIGNLKIRSIILEIYTPMDGDIFYIMRRIIQSRHNIYSFNKRFTERVPY